MSQIQCTCDRTKEVDFFITSNFFCIFKRGSKGGKDKKLQNSKIEIYLFICMCMLRNGCGLYEAPACDCHLYSSWLVWSESLHTAVELKSPSWRKIDLWLHRWQMGQVEHEFSHLLGQVVHSVHSGLDQHSSILTYGNYLVILGFFTSIAADRSWAAPCI